MKKFLILSSLILVLLGIGAPFSFPETVVAQETDQETAESKPTIPKPAFLPGPEEGAKVEETRAYFREQAIPGFIQGFLGLIAVLAFFAFCIGGIQYILSWGNEEQLKTAKNTLLWTVIGFIIAIFAYSIVAIINKVSLPTEEAEVVGGEESSGIIPLAFADNQPIQFDPSVCDNPENLTEEQKVYCLFPPEQILIEGSPNLPQGSSLPSGKLKTQVLPAMVNIILGLAGLLFFVGICYAGLLYITAHDNENQMKSAKNTLLYSVIGIAVIAFSYALIYGIAKMFAP